jgi:hypothetical protein
VVLDECCDYSKIKHWTERNIVRDEQNPLVCFPSSTQMRKLLLRGTELQLKVVGTI